MVIRTPQNWAWDEVSEAVHAIGSDRPADYWPAAPAPGTVATARRIGTADVWIALRRGLSDLGYFRMDVAFLCVVYPLVGWLLARIVMGQGMIHLLFPLVSGFALVGPFAAVGLVEMSRRRELNEDAHWTDAFRVFRSPAIWRIMGLGFALVGIFLAWMLIAEGIYQATLGARHEETLITLARDVAFTSGGHLLAAFGIGGGFVLAVCVLAVSVISFPMLLDRDVPLETAIMASLRVTRQNPVTIAIWGLVVAAGLVVGSVPVLLGLVILLPVLGHATWHLYRRVFPSPSGST